MMKRTFTAPWHDYELIDAGNNQKLDRWGKVVTIRPEMNRSEERRRGKECQY